MATLLYELSRKDIISPPYKNGANFWLSTNQKFAINGTVSQMADGVLLSNNATIRRFDWSIHVSTIVPTGWSMELYFKEIINANYKIYIFRNTYGIDSLFRNLYIDKTTQKILFQYGDWSSATPLALLSTPLTIVTNKWNHLYITITRTSTVCTGSMAFNGVTVATGSAACNTAIYYNITTVFNTPAYSPYCPFVIGGIREWSGFVYSNSGSFTPPPIPDYFDKFASPHTVPKATYTPYYAPYLRGKPYG